MNHHDVEPSADVRPFLPQPGEAVETYAHRLRGLHRDLTLVLDAVERGLQDRGAPLKRAPEPEPDPEPPAPVDVPVLEPIDLAPPPRVMAPGTGMARVEVISTPAVHEPVVHDRRATDRPPSPATALAAPVPPPPVAPSEAPAAPAEARLVLPPWVPAALLAGWLTVVALLVAVLLEG